MALRKVGSRVYLKANKSVGRVRNHDHYFGTLRYWVAWDVYPVTGHHEGVYQASELATNNPNTGAA